MNLAGRRILRRRGWALALLPALLVRAFIPAGFMPAVGDGSLALVFCEPGVAAGRHEHHHEADGAGHAGHGAAAECPFAQSAAPSLPTLSALPLTPPLVAHVPPRECATAALPQIPLRYAAARGPPALA